MPESSNAQIFFDQILNAEAGSFVFLEKLSLAIAHADENEWRDFKGASQITSHYRSQIPEDYQKQNNRKILEIWSEYLGAFANSGGGVLIWGIDAPKRFANGTSLVADVQRLSDRLIETANDVVDPPVQCVLVKPIPRDADSLQGFVVCLVPPSKFAPHRSKHAAREYYIRSQDGNINCPASVLRRLFYPMTFSLLVPEVTLYASLGADKSYHLQGTIDVRNRGHSTASDVFVVLEGGPSLNLNSEDWEKAPGNSTKYWAKRPIHPGQEVRLARNLTLGSGFHGWPDKDRVVTFRINLFAKDSTPVVRNFVVPWTRLRTAFESGTPKVITEGE